MNTAEYVGNLVTTQKAEGKNGQEIAWNAALACVDWAYVFGARGQYCTPANRRARYSDEHPTIKTKCKNYNGSGSAGCAGCKWYPGEKYTRFFDCRGFTYWILKQVYDGWELMGTGATAQWNTASNWKAKGTVADGIPENTLVCLFQAKGKTMEHTGFGLNNETVECQVGVQHFTQRKAKWTHWGVPVVIDGEVPTPTPPAPTKPTLRKGSSGQYVTLLQTELINRGYSCGSSGADGKFGAATEKAVKAFQQDHGLTADGICGPMTWKALDNAEPTIFYTVTVPHLTQAAANQLLTNYPGSTMTQE
jgi:hypothetical protein